MQTRNVTYYGICQTEYSNGSINATASSYFTENVQPGSSTNNGRKNRPWSNWSYVVRHTTHFHTEDGGYIKWRYPSGVSTKFVGAFGSASEIPRLPAWDRNTAYNSALSKLNEKVRGDLDLGVTLAELGSTKRMFKAIGKTISHAARLKPPGGYGSTRDVANGYLQYKYGWKPLLSDVFGIADEMIRVTLNAVQHIKAGTRFPINGPIGISSLRYINGTPNCQVALKGHGFSAAHFQLAVDVPGFDLSRFSSLNPVSLGWELIPYSFVVDWFVDVGSYLRNLETGLLYRTLFRGGYVSEIFHYEGLEKCETSNSYWSDDPTVEHKRVEADIDHTEFHRTVLTSYPLPRRPTFSVDLSSGQLFSAAALLRQMLKK
jgi:hypothetical protein